MGLFFRKDSRLRAEKSEIQGNKSADNAVESIAMNRSAGSAPKTDGTLFDRIYAQCESDANKQVNTSKKAETPSLVSRCLPYMIDDNGINVSEHFAPAYTLDSVEDIINSFEKKAEERITGLYSGKTVNKPEPIVKSQPMPEQKVPASGDLISELSKRMNEVRKVTQTEDIPMTTSIDSAKRSQIKTYQSSLGDTKILHGKEVLEKPASASEATQQFTKVDPESKLPLANTVDSKTIVLNDVPQPNKNYTPLSLEQSDDYDDIIDDLNGYTNFSDAKKFNKEFFKTKRTAFFALILTILVTLALVLLRMPFANSFRASDPQTFSAINLGLFAAACVFNWKIFKSFGCILGFELTSDLPFACSSVAVLIHSAVTLIWLNPSVTTDLTALASISLCFNALAKLFRATYIINNFRLIATPKKKSAFCFIKGPAAATVASDSFEGEALIGAGKKCINILGFVRNSESNDGAAKIVCISSAISIAISVLAGIALSFTTGNSSFGFAFACSLICLACPPASLLLSVLPMKQISDKLRAFRAVVPGYSAAGRIERINAIAVDCNMLFPEGCIELVNMKVLGNTSIDKILVGAASLTLSAKSPLAPIFRDIAITRGSNSVLPESDSVKYEDRMGISGWVDDHHLFVGNRTLLEAHGIKAAPIEVDKKILKNGGFPVYIAADGKPEALLIVRYTVDKSIKHQLLRSANTGMTILINNCDPNISSSMICDYFEVYDELIKIMPQKAADAYKAATNYEDSCFANASFDGDIKGLLSIATESIKLKPLVSTMCVLHILFQFLGIALAIYLSVSGIIKITAGMLCIYQLFTTLITLIPLVFRK